MMQHPATSGKTSLNNNMISHDDQNQPSFSDYDVILMPFSSQSGEEATARFVPGNFVGNRRFEVLLSIFRQKYAQAEMNKNERECQDIANQVIETVTTKCIPRGRFFENIHENVFQEIDVGPSIVQLIRNTLSKPPSFPHPINRAKRNCRGTSDTVCCKSNCNSMASRNRRISDVTSSCTSSENQCVLPNAFDVLCEANGVEILSGGHVGNNRLRVLFDIHMKKYRISNEVEKREIIHKILDSVINDSSSRFLQIDNSTGMFKQMTKEMSLYCVRNCIETHNYEKGKLQSVTARELVEGKRRRSKLDRAEKRRSTHDDSRLPVLFPASEQSSFSTRAA